jgi:hypothetical protein
MGCSSCSCPLHSQWGCDGQVIPFRRHAAQHKRKSENQGKHYCWDGGSTSYTSGIEYLAKELYAQPAIKEVRVKIMLPAEKIVPDLEQKMKTAVVRYCRARLKALEQEIQGLRKRAIEATLLAIVGLVIFISVGSILTYSRSFVIEVIGQGLTVVGWVFVWFPLDAFIFGLRH